MIITNEMSQRVDITTTRSLRRVSLHVCDVETAEGREVMLVTVVEARVLRDLLVAMDLGDNPATDAWYCDECGAICDEDTRTAPSSEHAPTCSLYRRDPSEDWFTEEECPAGGRHTWALQEEAGTGRTGWACDECHAPMPEQEDVR